MSKIIFINGSPRAKNSLSAQLIAYFCESLGGDSPVIFNAYQLVSKENTWVCYEELLTSKAIVVVAPLYVDGLPSHVMQFLQNLESYKRTTLSTDTPLLYGVMNCGFIEGSQNHIALNILENYALRMNWIWGGGVGIGGGEMFKNTKDKIPKQAKMMQPVYDALDTVITCFTDKKPIQAPNKQLLVNQKFSKVGFIAMGSFFWITEAWKNKVNCFALFRKE